MTTTSHLVQGGTATAVRILARDITMTDLLDEAGLLYPVTSVRLQGANPPEVVLGLAGIAGRRHYPAAAVLTVHREVT